jgi:uncharacterized protein YprB with RNaseH-like and TPR domain
MQWIRSSFPESTARAPGNAYLRIRHPLPSNAAGPSPDGSIRPGISLPPGLLLFDLETLGFLGHPLFLIGFLRSPRDGREGEVLQLLARDYTEEEAIVRAFGESGRRAPRWVSFNGKSFDLPFLRSRAAFHGVALPEPREHLDLLHLARRTYRGVLPDCRLQTLEDRVLRRGRQDDLPGSQIPQAYHEFVRTGDPSRLARILEHNRNDLLTLARLLLHLECGLDEEGS